MFLFLAVGCDNPMLSKSTDFDSEELQALSYELSSDLRLSQSSTDDLNDILKRHGQKTLVCPPTQQNATGCVVDNILSMI